MFLIFIPPYWASTSDDSRVVELFMVSITYAHNVKIAWGLFLSILQVVSVGRLYKNKCFASPPAEASSLGLRIVLYYYGTAYLKKI